MTLYGTYSAVLTSPLQVKDTFMLISKTVDLTSTPTLIVDGSELEGDVTVQIQTNTIVVIGDDTIVPSPPYGFFLESGEQDFTLNLEQGDSLYAAVASTGQVSVLVYNR